MNFPDLQCGRYRLPMSGERFRPLVMGILNVTPDSFSDGGRYQSLENALNRAEQMIAEGVDIIDIGGESTRPGSIAVPAEEELRRVMPVIHALRDCGKPLSLDTNKPEVMREAITAGIDMINDINGFRAPGALSPLKGSGCALCIMHMQSVPETMQHQPMYDDVTQDVLHFLRERVEAAENEGIARERLCIDPGFGFGKTMEHNLRLLNDLPLLTAGTGLPLLAGLSRKATIGALTGQPAHRRAAGSVAAALAAYSRGASIVRVHDVGDTVDAFKVWQAMMMNSSTTQH